ncbi:DUF397 domain-containing protein [Streptomyces cyaneofuscatus]|uniref:DUF397 domain-containing protein n=1 Tax=Streptomyces cyaneofuscatus TaxID=66883 RepID=UPI0033AF9BA8
MNEGVPDLARALRGVLAALFVLAHGVGPRRTDIDFAPVVPVRDGKNPHGPALTFAAADWTSFVSAVKGGDLTA